MGWALALHGGAGKILDTMPAAQRAEAEAALGEFLDAGIAALQASTPALEVVELVVRLLEGSPIFNAGLGSVLTTKGTIEMEASIMDGVSKRCGAVSGLNTVVHPISLARLVMEKTAHVYLAFAGAEAFARDQGVEMKDPTYFITPANQEKLKKALESGEVLLDHNLDHNLETPLSQGLDAQLETVGCVAVDSQGHCAAATSTGGLVNKMVGRIGDTPLIGAGTYADEYCAVSATGRGEEIIKAVAAKEVSALMEYKCFELNEAVETVVSKKTAKDTCGLIAVSSSGEVTTLFNTLGMYRASATENGFREIAIWETVNQNGHGHVKPERVKGHSKPVAGNGHVKPVLAVNGNGHAKCVAVNGRAKPDIANGHTFANGHTATMNGMNGHNSH